LNFEHLQVPARNDQTLTLPELAEYGRLIDHNRNLPRDIMVDGLPFETLARQARRSAVGYAANYTKKLGLDPGRLPDSGRAVIASGHQPTFFHPGVAVKNFALARQAGELGATAIFFSVDSDQFKAGRVFAPVMEERLAKKELSLFPVGRNLLYETAPVPSMGQLVKNLVHLDEKLSKSGLAAPGAALSAFLARIESIHQPMDNYTSLAIVLRRAWCGDLLGGCMESPVSGLCGQKPFLRYAKDLIERIEDFRNIYNEQLARYRKDHKLRYPANPFPDLGQSHGAIETPFWVIDSGARQPLFVRLQSAGHSLLESVTGGAWTMAELESGQVNIRPKAISLSIYLRLFICDLFIHGVGGSKYDTITDRIIERFYGIEPPMRACVSCTALLNIDAPDPEERMESVKQVLRDIEHHPEKTGGEDGHIRKLADEKSRLVAMIRRPGVDRKAVGRKISGLNEQMTAHLAPLRSKLEKELEVLRGQEKEKQAARARDYPYFLFDPERVADLLK